MIRRMRVRWIGFRPDLDEHADIEHNVYILVLWGNPRDIAIRAAEWRRFWLTSTHHCVQAWVNPINWRELNIGL